MLIFCLVLSVASHDIVKGLGYHGKQRGSRASKSTILLLSDKCRRCTDRFCCSIGLEQMETAEFKLISVVKCAEVLHALSQLEERVSSEQELPMYE